MVAGNGIEPLSPDAKSDVLPLHHPAMVHRPATANHMAGPCREKERLKEHAEEFVNEVTEQDNGEKDHKALYVAEHRECFSDVKHEMLKLFSSNRTSHL